MIDFHTHFFPDKVAEKSIPFLSSVCNMPPYTDGKVNGLLKSAKEAGIDQCIVLPVATTPFQYESINRFASQFLEGDFISFGSLHPDNDNYKEILKQIKAYGLKGIKFHPDYQHTYFNDIKYKRIMSYASELDLIIVTHAGQDPFSPDDIHCTPKMIEEVLDEVAPTKLVLAHMGGNLMYEDVEHYLVGRDVYFDTAYVLDKTPVETIMRLIKLHGADRILFGTDSPWGGQKEFINSFNRLPLSEEERTMISHLNTEKLLKDCR